MIYDEDAQKVLTKRKSGNTIVFGILSELIFVIKGRFSYRILLINQVISILLLKFPK